MIPPSRRLVKSRFGSARLTQRSGPAQDGEALDDAEGRRRTCGTKAEITLLSIACNALLHSRMKSRTRRCERAVHGGEKSWPCVISPVYTRSDSSGFTGKPPVRNKLGRAIGPAPFSFPRAIRKHPSPRRHPTISVTPAKAGAHGRARAGRRRDRRPPWIPACAGMTDQGGAHPQFPLRHSPPPPPLHLLHHPPVPN